MRINFLVVKHIIYPLLFILLVSCNSNKEIIENDCQLIKVKYLETYLDSRMWEAAGGNLELTRDEISNFSTMTDEELMQAQFFIPFFINKIDSFNQDLKGVDRDFLHALSLVISKIWGDDSIVVPPSDPPYLACSKVNQIVSKYHDLSEDNDEFYKMILTFDDGPFFGFDTVDKLKKVNEIHFDSFKLILRSNGQKNTFEVVDQDGKVKWRKFIARDEDYFLRDVAFADRPLRVSDDLGYKIALYGDGELIQLYLTKSGDFRLFFHSW